MRFLNKKPPSADVIKRLSREKFDGGTKMDLNEYHHKHREGTVEAKTNSFFKLIRDRLSPDQALAIVLNNPIAPRAQEIGRSDIRSEIEYLYVNCPVSLRLVNLSIGILQIDGSTTIQTELERCDVAQLRVGSVRAELRTKQTNIGVLYLHANSLDHFEMVGGCLLNIYCPSPGEPNPFTGTVSFSADVFFPRDRHRYLLKGPQPYRNLRHHLRDLENAQMANLIHSAELAVERDDDSLPNRIISRLYELFSDFGSSALRPLVWLVVFAVVSFSATYFTSGATLTLQPNQYVGWQSIFLRTDCVGDAFKALYLSIQPVANPLGIFAKTPLLIAKSPWLALWLSFQGFVSVVLIALTIFAIRRRFKIAS